MVLLFRSEWWPLTKKQWQTSTMTNEESRYGPDNVQAVPGDDKCPLDSCGVAAMCVFTLVSAALPSLSTA